MNENQPVQARRPVQKGFILAAGAIVLPALAIRLAGIRSTELWADEGVTLMYLRASWWDLVARMPTASDHPPLPFLLFKAWSLVFQSEWGLRLLPVLLGTGAVAALMAAARELHPKAAIPTGLLAAVSPVPVHYSQELRGYSLLYLLTALTLWSAAGMLRAPSVGWRVVLFSIAAALAAHTHPVGLFVFPMATMFLWVTGGRAALKPLLNPRGGWLWLLLIAPMIWFGLYWSTEHRLDWWIPQLSAPTMRSYAEEYFGLNIVESWQRSRSPRPWWTGFILERMILLSAGVLVLSGLLDRRLRRPIGGLAAAAGAYISLMAVAGLVSVPNTIVRTLLPAWAPIMLLLGCCGTALAGAGRRAVPLAALSVLAFLHTAGWIWLVKEGPARRPPSRQAYHWVASQIGPRDVVVSAWGLPELTGYHLGELIPTEQLLGTSVPLLEGSPPVRRMVTAREDPAWRDRFRAAFAAADQASGGRYSVWYIGFGFVENASPGNVIDVIHERHRQQGEYMDERTWGIVAARYMPREPQTRN